jgi:NADPH-dependent curcumin reductase CurA
MNRRIVLAQRPQPAASLESFAPSYAAPVPLGGVMTGQTVLSGRNVGKLVVDLEVPHGARV